MNEINQKLNIAANVFIVVLSLLIGAIVVQKYVLNSQGNSSQSVNNAGSLQSKNRASTQKERVQPIIGSKLNLPDINLSQYPKTLILALRQGCHYCTESAAFYKRLTQEAQNRNIKLVAVFPGGIDESTSYLNKLGISDLQIKHANLSNLQVPGTPTLILANNEGEIINFWIGKLPPEKEMEVINSL